MAGHIFVSYVRDNAQLVDQLSRDLTARGADVWIDRDRLRPGPRWHDSVKTAISGGDLFLACFSSEYSAREKSYMNEELTLAIDELRQRPTDRAWFIPVLLSGKIIPDRRISAGESLRDLQYVDLTADWLAGIEAIARALFERRLDTARNQTKQSQSATNPEETVVDKASRIARKSRDEKLRIEFLESTQGVSAALEEVESLYFSVSAIVNGLMMPAGSIPVEVEINNPSCAIRGGGYTVLLTWVYRYSNSLRDAFLAVNEFERSYFLRGIAQIDGPKKLRERKYHFDVRSGSRGWASSDRGLLTTEELADHVIDLLLSRIEQHSSAVNRR